MLSLFKHAVLFFLWVTNSCGVAWQMHTRLFKTLPHCLPEVGPPAGSAAGGELYFLCSFAGRRFQLRAVLPLLLFPRLTLAPRVSPVCSPTNHQTPLWGDVAAHDSFACSLLRCCCSPRVWAKLFIFWIYIIFCYFAKRVHLSLHIVHSICL